MLIHRKAAFLRRGSAGRIARPLWLCYRRKAAASRAIHNLWLYVFRVGPISCPIWRVSRPGYTTIPPKGRTPEFGPFLCVCAGIENLVIFAPDGGRACGCTPCKNSFAPVWPTGCAGVLLLRPGSRGRLRLWAASFSQSCAGRCKHRGGAGECPGVPYSNNANNPNNANNTNNAYMLLFIFALLLLFTIFAVTNFCRYG